MFFYQMVLPGDCCCWDFQHCFLKVCFDEVQNHSGVKAEVRHVFQTEIKNKADALLFQQGAERKMRDEERKRVKRRIKNVADSTNSGKDPPSYPLTCCIIPPPDITVTK